MVCKSAINHSWWALDWEFCLNIILLKHGLDPCGLSLLITAPHRSGQPPVEVKWFSCFTQILQAQQHFCEFLSHVIMWHCCFFLIKTDFFANLSGRSLLATTAAVSIHTKTTVCQYKNKKRGTQRRGATRFSQYKTSTVLCPLQREFVNIGFIYAQGGQSNTVCMGWMQDFYHSFLLIISGSLFLAFKNHMYYRQYSKLLCQSL